MRQAVYLVSLFSLVGLATPLQAQDGRLQNVREEVRSKEQTPSPEDNGDQSSVPTEDEPGIFAELFGHVCLQLVGFPFALPHHALGDDFEKFLYFSRHPYQATYPGYLMIHPWDSPSFAEKWGSACKPKDWSLRLSVENGNDFDGLNRANGQLLLDTTSRFGILTSWNYFHERLECGCTDHLLLGDFNVTFRFAQNEKVMMRTGLGFRTLLDHGDTDWGFNFHYGADFFPVSPVVVTGSIDAGTLGSAGVFHARGTIGVTRHGWELFGGYDFLHIGDANLHGPMLGVRLWF